MLLLEILALFAIMLVIVVMAINNEDGVVSGTDRYSGSAQLPTDNFPTAIPDLVDAVDQQLVRINEPQEALERLSDFGEVAGELAGDDEALSTVFAAWIAAGTVELEAAAAMNEVCAEAGVRSEACAAGIETHAASVRDTAAVREQVCALITCPS